LKPVGTQTLKGRQNRLDIVDGVVGLGHADDAARQGIAAPAPQRADSDLDLGFDAVALGVAVPSGVVLLQDHCCLVESPAPWLLRLETRHMQGSGEGVGESDTHGLSPQTIADR